MSTLVHAIGFGLVTASILALAAVAISLQVSVTNFINFAYGDFMTFGAYIAWVVGRYGGRAFVDRYGKYVLLTHHDLDRGAAALRGDTGKHVACRTIPADAR